MGPRLCGAPGGEDLGAMALRVCAALLGSLTVRHLPPSLAHTRIAGLVCFCYFGTTGSFGSMTPRFLTTLK